MGRVNMAQRGRKPLGLTSSNRPQETFVQDQISHSGTCNLGFLLQS